MRWAIIRYKNSSGGNFFFETKPYPLHRARKTADNLRSMNCREVHLIDSGPWEPEKEKKLCLNET